VLRDRWSLTSTDSAFTPEWLRFAPEHPREVDEVGLTSFFNQGRVEIRRDEKVKLEFVGPEGRR